MKKTIRDRSMFTVIACIVLAVCILAPKASVKQVKLAPEMEILVGEERTAAFYNFFEKVQVWYNGKTVAADGVMFTQEADFDQVVDIMNDGVTYLDRGETTLDSLSPAVQEAYEIADVNMAFFILGVVVQPPNILAQQESYTCDQTVWESIGTAIDDLVGLYQTAYYTE